jgi:hypothetical protein
LFLFVLLEVEWLDAGIDAPVVAHSEGKRSLVLVVTWAILDNDMPIEDIVGLLVDNVVAVPDDVAIRVEEAEEPLLIVLSDDEAPINETPLHCGRSTVLGIVEMRVNDVKDGMIKDVEYGTNDVWLLEIR